LNEHVSFQKELTALINKHSLENGSNTPDFLLAGYLHECLLAFNSATRTREDWYGRTYDSPASTPAGSSLEHIPFNQSQSIVVSWDYREQPNWIDIQAALRAFDHPQITTVEHTGDDQIAVIISNRLFTQEEAAARYSLE